jgi:hypothetical protein
VNMWIGFAPLSTVYASVAAVNANSIVAVIFFQGRPCTMQSVIIMIFRRVRKIAKSDC